MVPLILAALDFNNLIPIALSGVFSAGAAYAVIRSDASQAKRKLDAIENRLDRIEAASHSDTNFAAQMQIRVETLERERREWSEKLDSALIVMQRLENQIVRLNTLLEQRGNR